MGDNNLQSESLEMAKASYGFKATVAKTLSFKENDHFIIYHQSTKERNWWQVVNSKAQVGYVPSNYVTSVQVTPQYLLKFLENCISILEDDKAELPSDKKELLLRLIEKRKYVSTKIEKSQPLPPAPVLHPKPSVSKISPPLILSPSSSHAKSVTSLPEFQETKPLPKPKPEHQEAKKTVSEIVGQIGEPLVNVRRKSSVTPIVTSSLGIDPSIVTSHKSQDVNEEIVYNLVEQVRRQTELSHELSRVAVSVIVTELEKLLPETEILRKILDVLQGPMNVSQPMIEQTHDAKRLNVIFSELTSCKDDAQQRSWMLHEDEDVIIDYIKELISILMNADGSISRHVISSDQYAGVVALTQYYQMEVRWSIRQPLLQALGVLCSLDKSIINIFLSSVLPMELARDMKANPRNVPKLNYSALLLTMIFSMGEPMPITHLEHLGSDFVNFLFNHIESPPDTDVEDQIPDLFVTLVLSYNLQFKSVSDNVLIRTLGDRAVAKTFTEKILLLLNREDDPVRIFEHEPPPPHSVLKLFIDLFSSISTANLFYTNDVKVLIDIIVRQLADLSPGDQRRNQYLQLCRVVMRNSGYSEHHHRRDDLHKSFTRIFCEETEISLKDQQLVREISNEFPQYFK